MSAKKPLVLDSNANLQQIQTGDFLDIPNGGTGATTAAGALTALGAYAASNPNNYITSAGAPVQSVAGRTGAVVLAQADISGLTTTSTPTFAAVVAGTFTGALAGNANTSTSVQGGVAGALHYQSAVGVTGFSAAGTSGQVVLSGGVGAPTFINQNALTLQSSQVTNALGFTPVNAATQGTANGVATLDASGRLTTSQIPAALVGAMQYQGVWNASTNSPTLVSGVGVKGQYYKVSNAGSTTLDSISQWNIGDMVAYDGTTWDKIDGLNSEVTSVAGRIGAVVLSQADISGLTTASTPTFTGVNATTFTGALAGNAATATLAATVTTNANLSGDVTSVGNVTTVVKLNNTSLAGLSTGLLKNTTGTGVPSIATTSDITTLLGTGNITNAMLANSSVTIGSTNIALGATVSTLANVTLTGAALGTPASGVLTNCTGYTYANLSGTVPTWNQNTTGTAVNVTGVVSVNNGGTGATTATAAATALGVGTGNTPTFAGVSAPIVFSLLNDQGAQVNPGACVYTDTSGTFMLAKADAAATSNPFGLVVNTIITGASGNVATDGILTLTTAQWNTITGGSSGLTAGANYFLSATTAGGLTTTPPSIVGQYVVKVGQALSTTTMAINFGFRVQL